MGIEPRRTIDVGSVVATPPSRTMVGVVGELNRTDADDGRAALPTEPSRMDEQGTPGEDNPRT